MPDISMCPDTKCPVAGECVRNTASGTIPEQYQTFSDFTHEGPQGCGEFWPSPESNRPASVQQPLIGLQRTTELHRQARRKRAAAKEGK